MSEKRVGGRRENRPTYSAPSTWNRPSMLPERMSANAFSSSMGISSGTIFVPKRRSTLRHAIVSTSSVRRPRKSIFRSPRSGV